MNFEVLSELEALEYTAKEKYISISITSFKGESMQPALDMYLRIRKLPEFKTNKELQDFLKDNNVKNILDLRSKNESDSSRE